MNKVGEESILRWLNEERVFDVTLSKDKTELTVIEDGETTHLDKQQALKLSVTLINMGKDLKRLAKRMEQ